MQHVGVDIIEIDRIEVAISYWGELFLRRIYTDAELRLHRGQFPSLAVHFAGKEAVIKVLGGRSRGFRWRDIEILPDPRGKPLVYLQGSTRSQADSLGLTNLSISFSHSKEYAVAVAIGEVE
ncbi:MAG: holo-ACP synthase [Dehalococcoidales bacterium]|nr:holo-ACP synthase [Dehalococcoidales bacterium]